jgi:hypothetical protein
VATSRLAESRYRPVAAVAERVRQAMDLEHWPAFGRSFDALAALLSQLDLQVASVSVLSGDVHHSYVARPDLTSAPRPDLTSTTRPDLTSTARPDLTSTARTDLTSAPHPDLGGPPIHQLTCSPVHNRVPPLMKPVFRTAWSAGAARVGRALSRAAGAEPTPISWAKLAGPYFGNAVGTLVHSGRSAQVTIEGTDANAKLVNVAQVPLTPSRAPAAPENVGVDRYGNGHGDT